MGRPLESSRTLGRGLKKNNRRTNKKGEKS